MSTAILMIGGVAALVLLGAVAMLIARRWGGARGQAGVLPLDPPLDPPRAPYRSVASIPESERAAIRALIASGKTISAIKRVRELTGVGLKEAKDYVETWISGGAPALQVAPPAATSDLGDVRALLQQGRKIEAIKVYRELSGVGLKEAKDYVDALEAGLPPPSASPPTPASGGSMDEVRALALQGNKIGAIKRYRELTGVGLKEAKDYVDRL